MEAHNKAQAERDRLLKDLLGQLLTELRTNIADIRASTTSSNNTTIDAITTTTSNNSDTVVELNSNTSMGISMVMDSSTATATSASSSSSSSSSMKHISVFDVANLYGVVEESCLVPVIESYLKNASFVEMERHIELYHIIFQVK